MEFHCPSSVMAIGPYAFSGCKSLVKFILKEDSLLRSFEYAAFKDCSIRDFAITKNLNIDECDFSGIITLGDNFSDKYVVEGGLLMDINRKSLLGVFLEDNESVCIPSSVEFIHWEAFHSKLGTVSFEKSSKLKTIEFGSLNNRFIEKLVLPVSFENFSNISRRFVRNVEVEIGNPNFESFDGLIVSSDSRVLYKYFGDDTNVTIPSYIEEIASRCFEYSSIETVSFSECDVKKIGALAFSNSSLTSITLPDSLESIERDCFALCKNIQEIEFPSSLVEVQRGIFTDSGIKSISFVCPRLEVLSESMFRNSGLIRIVIPRSVKRIGQQCFCLCRFLVDVSFEAESELEELEAFCFAGTSIESISIPRMVRNIGKECFRRCGKLSTVSFEPGSELVRLSEKCFSETSLERICLPRTVESIESECFSLCSKLSEFRFEDDAVIKELGDIFGQNMHIKAFIPKSVTVLSPKALSSISSLELEPGSPLSVPEQYLSGHDGLIHPGTDTLFIEQQKIKSVQFAAEWKETRLVDRMFYKSSLEKIVIPKCVTVIDNECFYGCQHLKVVVFEAESELKEIHSAAFSDSGVNEIVIPRLVEEIGDSAFCNCSSLAKVEFEAGSQLKVIGQSAFECTSLTDVSIPDSVTKLGKCCFHKTKMKECRIGENSQLEILGGSVFTHLPHLFIPSKLVKLPYYFFNWVDNITVSPQNPLFCVVGQLLMNRDQTSLYRFLYPSDSVVIPRTVKVIEESCFRWISDLISVEFEEGSELEVVKSNAFHSTSLTRIRFPRKLRKLSKCFDMCEKLSEVSFHDDCPLEEIPEFGYGLKDITINIPSNVSKIDRETLWCTKELHLSDKNQHFKALNQFIYHSSGELLGQIGDTREVVIPKSVTMIPENLFRGRRIVSVAFENESLLTEIGKNAFDSCRCLKTVLLQNVYYLKRIREEAFSDCVALSIEIPRSVEVIDFNAFHGVPDVSVEPGSSCFSVADGMLMNVKGTALMGFYGDEKDGFILEKQIEIIGKDCFTKHSGKFEYEEGSCLETIEERAFYNTYFEQVEIPSGVTTIGRNCFRLASLKNICFGSASKLLLFEKGLFRESQLSSIVIPAGITELGAKCFCGARNLESVSFGGDSSLVCIWRRCFYQCESLSHFEFEQCKNLQYIHEESFIQTKLQELKLHSNPEFIANSAVEESVRITVFNDIEDKCHGVLEWAKTRIGDFVRKREDDFYRGKDFHKQEPSIGHGTYGTVYLLENKFTSEKFALKEINDNHTSIDQLEREIELMKYLSHPCIVSLIGFRLSRPMSLCMEYLCNGTLEDALAESPAWFDSTRKVIIIVGIAAGMFHIHLRNVIHRDLKPSNILLDSSYEVRISDFGTAHFDGESSSMNAGTPLYLAPELRDGVSNDITQKVDVFAFGLILYQIIENVSVSELKNRLNNLSFSSGESGARDLIEACLEPDPKRRLAFSDIIEELVTSQFELIEGVDTEAVSQYYNRICSQLESASSN